MAERKRERERVPKNMYILRNGKAKSVTSSRDEETNTALQILIFMHWDSIVTKD